MVIFPPWQIVCGVTWWLRAVSGEMERQRSTVGQADGVSCADLWWLSLWPCLSRIKFLKCKLFHMISSGGWYTGLSLSLSLSLSVYLSVLSPSLSLCSYNLWFHFHSVFFLPSVAGHCFTCLSLWLKMLFNFIQCSGHREHWDISNDLVDLCGRNHI